MQDVLRDCSKQNDGRGSMKVWESQEANIEAGDIFPLPWSMTGGFR